MLTFPSAVGDTNTTAPPSPSCCCRLCAAPCRSAAATPSSSATSHAPPPGAASAWLASAADLASAIWDLRLATSAAVAFSSSCRAPTRSTTPSGLTLKRLDSSRTIPSSPVRYSTCAAPATASTRRTPDAMPPSEMILKPPISAVLATCVPPQSSMLRPGTSTTRTVSPYFSPNMAVAPAALASAMGIVATCSACASCTHSFTSPSTCCTSSSVMPRGRLKSKRRRSASTSEPCWLVPSPSTRLSAD
mmetsp:Transcript_16790/g.43553  ORF Transcript_16790/g.43553 Transcript_16790/m.43553 type:complete len:247 (+) Transcript_16790:385-1125(+)